MNSSCSDIVLVKDVAKDMMRWCRVLVAVCLMALYVEQVSGQCPWHREVQDLQSSCLCAYNLAHELSVQCDMVDFAKLLSALDRFARNTPLDLLYVNNSTVGGLRDSIFANLKIHNIQLSGCKIKSVSKGAFIGQEPYLKNLNLQENDLTVVPVESLHTLTNLSLLDLSKNRISEVPDEAFVTLTKLATLKLSDNNVTLAPGALRGLENSLKNLNLKGTRQKSVPDAVRGLVNLAFLDLSQNSLRELPGPDSRDFDGLDSLTALNLERNLLQSLGENAFDGVKTTLSSLSLLNNLLPDFPRVALSELKELRVLDIGFNLLTELPNDAFHGNPSITLLALDGNPLSTVPFAALSHLNNTLRGLSLGGRFLHCDCRLKWVINWIRNGDLQVTSRERNPQFCGSPPRFRERGFYSIQPEELTCTEGIGVATVVSEEADEIFLQDDAVVPVVKPSTTTTTTERPSTVASSTATKTSRTSTTTTPSTTVSTTKESRKTSTASSASTSSTTTKPSSKANRSTVPPWRQQRPPLVMGFPPRKTDDSTEVLVKNAYRQDNSVIIQWASDTANILGFRVVYRLFGDKIFKQGPPLEASEREFKIKNVPSQVIIIAAMNHDVEFRVEFLIIIMIVICRNALSFV